MDFKVGHRQHCGGGLKITGGELTVSSRYFLAVGHNNNQTRTLTLAGGKLTLNSRDDAAPDARSFRIGSGCAPIPRES